MRNQQDEIPINEQRFLEARLRMVVDTLTATIVLNPVWTAFLYFPFAITKGPFGSVPLSHLAAAVGLHLLISLWAGAIYWRNRISIRDPRRLEGMLFVLQACISLCWGTVAWLFWDPASQVNNIYVTTVMVSVTWSIVYTRVAHTAIFVAGVAPLTVVFWGRLIATPGEVSNVLIGLIVLWTVYIAAMGLGGRNKIDALLRAQFATEDLSVALRASNDEALRKRYEAETANAAKTTFLANMSHELRTPLNAILGFSDIIAQQALGPQATGRYAEYAGDIHSSGEHLLSLINDLLDVAKIEAGKMEIEPKPLSVPAMFDNIERLLAPRARARHQVIGYHAALDLPYVIADERAFKQIVLNLLSNALKFAPEGGRIDVTCVRTPDGGVQLEVSDNGPGIAPEKLARVFQPFSQIDNRYGRASGGTGLGLALVRGLAELHGGRATIDSTLGEGTLVSVYFPSTVEPFAHAATG